MGYYAVWVVLLLSFVMANLPFLFERIFFVISPKNGRKALGWRALELLLLYAVVGVVAAALEYKAHGSVQPQQTVFFAVTVSLFLVSAFPGFVYRYLLRDRGDRRQATLEK